MPSAVVTGGAGFIGSTLTRLLLERGYSVRVYDDLSSGSREHLEGLDVELVMGDVRDLESLRAPATGSMRCSTWRRERGSWTRSRTRSRTST